MAAKNEIPIQQKIALGILLMIGLFMFYSKVYVPLKAKIKETQEVLEKKEAELADMRRIAGKLDKLEKEFIAIEAKLKLTERKLPKSEELPAFIRLITERASKYGMDVTNLRISSPKVDQYYITHIYSLSLSSDYHTFGSFFTEIVQLERIFNVRDVTFAPTVSDEGMSQLSASFSIVAYTSKE